jgi:predicted nucleic acid-binding protein
MILETKPRVFLDTNVLFSGVHSESGIPKRLLDAAGLGQYQIVASRLVLNELVRNLRTKSPGSLVKLERVLREVKFEMVPHPPDEEITRWRDAGLGTDAPIVAAAVLAEVDYFCTGDRRLLEKASLMQQAGLCVVAPGELLEKLA